MVRRAPTASPRHDRARAAGSLLRTTRRRRTDNPFEPSLAKLIPSDALAYLAFHGAQGMSRASREPLASPRRRSGRSKTSCARRETSSPAKMRCTCDPPRAVSLRSPSSRSREPEPTERRPSIASSRARSSGRGSAHAQLAGLDARTIPFGGGFGLHYANVGRNLVVSDLDGRGRRLRERRPRPSAVGHLLGRTRSGRCAAAGRRALLRRHPRWGRPRRASFEGADSRRRQAQPRPAQFQVVEYASGRPSEVQMTLFVHIKP